METLVTMIQNVEEGHAVYSRGEVINLLSKLNQILEEKPKSLCYDLKVIRQAASELYEDQKKEILDSVSDLLQNHMQYFDVSLNNMQIQVEFDTRNIMRDLNRSNAIEGDEFADMIEDKVNEIVNGPSLNNDMSEDES